MEDFEEIRMGDMTILEPKDKEDTLLMLIAKVLVTLIAIAAWTALVIALSRPELVVTP